MLAEPTLSSTEHKNGLIRIYTYKILIFKTTEMKPNQGSTNIYNQMIYIKSLAKQNWIIKTEYFFRYSEK